MKKIKTAAFFLGLILVGSGLSCNTFSGGDSSNANKTSAADCPTTTLTVNDLTGGNSEPLYERFKESVGCTVSVIGELREVKSDAVELRDTKDLGGTVKCKGDFSSDTFRQIGYKLDTFKEKSPYEKLPVATFTAKIVESSGFARELELDNCRMSDYGK